MARVKSLDPVQFVGATVQNPFAVQLESQNGESRSKRVTMLLADCPFPKCVYSTISLLRLRGHLVGHTPDAIYDYAFDHKLLPNTPDQDNTVFHYVIS